MLVIAHVFIEAFHLVNNNKSSAITLKFEEKEKVFDPKKVYRDSSNPTKI